MGNSAYAASGEDFEDGIGQELLEDPVLITWPNDYLLPPPPTTRPLQLQMQRLRRPRVDGPGGSCSRSLQNSFRGPSRTSLLGCKQQEETSCGVQDQEKEQALYSRVAVIQYGLVAILLHFTAAFIHNHEDASTSTGGREPRAG